jgi:hypothetical protein
MSGRVASAALLTRFRAFYAEAKALDSDCQKYGDRELGDVVKRARREIEEGIRRGLPKDRGGNF